MSGGHLSCISSAREATKGIPEKKCQWLTRRSFDQRQGAFQRPGKNSWIETCSADPERRMSASTEMVFSPALDFTDVVAVQVGLFSEHFLREIRAALRR